MCSLKRNSKTQSAFVIWHQLSISELIYQSLIHAQFELRCAVCINYKTESLGVLFKKWQQLPLLPKIFFWFGDHRNTHLYLTSNRYFYSPNDKGNLQGRIWGKQIWSPTNVEFYSGQSQRKPGKQNFHRPTHLQNHLQECLIQTSVI